MYAGDQRMCCGVLTVPETFLQLCLFVQLLEPSDLFTCLIILLIQIIDLVPSQRMQITV